MRPFLPFQETYNQSDADHHLSSPHIGPLNYCGHCVWAFYPDTCCMHPMHSRLFHDRPVLSPVDFCRVCGGQHLTRMELCNGQCGFGHERSKIFCHPVDMCTGTLPVSQPYNSRRVSRSFAILLQGCNVLIHPGHHNCMELSEDLPQSFT